MRPPRRLAHLARRGLNCFLDQFLEPGCIRCRSRSLDRAAAVCLSCWAQVRCDAPPIDGCLLCGEPACTCLTQPPPWDWLVSACRYEGVGRDLILLYKFGPWGGRPLMARPLAGFLAAAALTSGICRGIDLLVGVPSHRSRVRQRGFDAPHLLTKDLCRRFRLPPAARLLVRTGREGPRTARRRTARPAGRFRLRQRAAGSLAGKIVLLLDDVLTTGTTLRECAGLLATAGAREVRTLVLARTPRRATAQEAAPRFDRIPPIV